MVCTFEHRSLMAGRVRRYAACNDGLENAVRFMVWINRIMLRVAYQNPYIHTPLRYAGREAT